MDPASESTGDQGPHFGPGLRTDQSGQRTHPLTAVLQGLLWGTAVAAALGWQLVDDPTWHELLIIPGGFLIGLLAGWVSWLFTRYVIDDAEIRIERGVIFRSSRRIPFARLQSVDINEPLLARIVGLSELTLEMAGGAESKTRLRFLTLTESRRMRRMLVARAHGEQAGTPAAEYSEPPREILHVVPPDQIIVGTLLSLDFMATLLGTILSIAAVLAVDLSWASIGLVFGILLPAAFALVQMTGDRVIAQWNFTVSRGDRGLRIDRGLLGRSSQTIPYDRVQAIGIIEPLVWRAFSWSRLDVDIAGYGKSSDESGGVSSTTLLPIANRDLARRLVDELVPDAQRGSGERFRPPARSMLFAPIGWRHRWFASTNETVTAATGWLTRRRAILPLHKVQSVEFSQGPVERRLHLASVHVHSPDGPVHASILHLQQQTAHDLAFHEVDLARAARQTVRDQPPLTASSASASSAPTTSRDDNQPSGSTTLFGEP